MNIPSLSKRALLLIAIAITGSAHCATRLIGISNKTGRGTFPTPRIAVAGTNITSIPYTADNIGLQPIKLNLPVEVTLTYGSTINEGKPYTISISESGGLGNCQDNKKMIVAQIKESNLASNQTGCVTLAKNSFSTSGDQFEWSNVVLAIANNPEYQTNTKALPFKFGLAPWTSTKAPWNRQFVTSPSDTKAIAFNTTWNNQPQAGLKVMQGNGAWMGGDITQNMLPKKGYNQIVHIYNNTPYVLNIARNVRQAGLSGANFNQLLPAGTATPWAMAWIPTVPSSSFNPNVDQQLSCLQIFALYAPEADQPPLPGAQPILTKAGSTEFSIGQSAEDILAKMEAGHSKYISDLLGETPIRDLMPDIDKDQYAVDNSYFKIFTLDNKNGQTIIQKCTSGTDTCTQYAKVNPPATHPQFGYFKLIVSENKDNVEKNGSIKLELLPMPLEQVLEN